ncbi:hypothetical protein [Streptomyces subrutilus]|uniref:Uncharacterized protein n=1 Tax=Streptomyces subrutilus TaxID=36818 RepID=A0A1E5NXI0_9ACTN|nr:hypothetical protein [Streptomyces subrutilus]OEJ20947.1 hypothetical protein BGK67_35525 [Streptomyces subrutilus]
MTDQTAGSADTSTTCDFPECFRVRKQKAPGTPGPTPKYCDDPDHTPLKALRWRNRHKSETASDTAAVPDDLSAMPHSSAVAEAQTVEGELRALMGQLLQRLPAHLQAIEAAGDPELANQQVANAQNKARLAINKAEADLGTEREKRIAAETEQRRLTSLYEEARGAAIEADGLRGRAEKAKEEAQEVAAGAVRDQEAATERAGKEIAAVRRETEEAINQAKTEADTRIEENRVQLQAVVDETVRTTDELVKKARADAEREIADITKKLEDLREETASKIASAREETATLKAQVVTALGAAKEAKEARREAIEEHLRQTAQLHEQLNSDRDRLLGELETTRKLSQQHVEAAKTAERARAAAQRRITSLEKELRAAAAKLQKARASTPAGDNADAPAPNDEQDPGFIHPDQSSIVDGEGRPVAEGDGQ